MQEYILILRNTRTPAEVLAKLKTQWGQVIPEWTRKGHFVNSYVLIVGGQLITGEERIVSDNIINEGDRILTAVIIIKAASMEEAVMLSKECPTLAAGGTVELREVAPRPAVTAN